MIEGNNGSGADTYSMTELVMDLLACFNGDEVSVVEDNMVHLEKI